MNTIRRSFLITGILFATAVYMLVHHNQTSPLARPLQELPAEIGQWRMTQSSLFDQPTLDLLRPTEYLVRQYKRPDGAIANLYIGYHDAAQDAGHLHSPRNCMPGSGWYEDLFEKLTLSMQGRDVDVNLAVYSKGQTSELFIYWYIVSGEIISNELDLRIKNMIDSIEHGRDCTSFVRVSVPFNGDKSLATDQAVSFVNDLQPILLHSLRLR